ncbi:DNA breaking-rejoining enzyme, catalytic core [Halomonas sp. 1513]|nr:tyrosine-type recombinase/integrase [Halomonas sp. 1513]APX91772.1 DNA breaking-rejoining enzyme, catalytic core [Halomonas sp. 1513]
MAEFLKEVWSGWKLIDVPEGAGGAEARHRQHLVARRRHQKAVLELMWETHPELVRGERGVRVSPEITRQWETTLQGAASGSVVEVRHKINFLSLGLMRGQRELGWEVVVPAPLRLVSPPTSPFTPSSFEGLSIYRDGCRQIDAMLLHPAFQILLANGNGRAGHRRLEPEMLSWGLFLYLVITRDGLLGSKQLYSLPLATSTLAAHEASAWLVQYEAVPDDLPGKVPPRSRWMLGVQALAVLMRHIDAFGHPGDKLDGYQQAKDYTKKAWRQFTRAMDAEHMTLSACQENAATAFRLHVPEYLVRSSMGKHMGTSLTEARWRQLLIGGYVEHASPVQGLEHQSEAAEAEIGPAKPTMLQGVRDQPLYEGRTLLKSLHVAFYKQRDQKRLRFGEISYRLEEAITAARRMAPIVECLCRWILFLHRKKRKQSTLYKYLGVTMPLLQAMGDTSVDQDRLPVLLEAYQYVIEQAKTEENRGYRWSVLRSFHSFLVAELGLANVTMEFIDGGATIPHHADANCVSEEEYQQIAGHLAQHKSALGKIRYWIFVLGFRAGLRIGEALSIQLDDLLFSYQVEESDVILLIRNNVYVDTKSYDSRRQLPLHHLLTHEELKGFKGFVINRQAVARHGRVMLFGEGGDSVAPLRDERVQGEIHEAMRRITGDPSLRYHHLRHSLANYLLLSFHGVEVPWSAPSHHAILWQEVTGGASRSGLYFIAQVMGHASPDVTLRSYLHFTCLLIDHYCHQRTTAVAHDNRRHAVSQLEALGDVVDVKPATLRKWKQRYGERPPVWLGRAYPECRLTDLAQQEAQSFPILQSADPPGQQGLAQLSLEQVEAALESLHFRDVAQVDRIFDLREGEAQALADCAYRVLTESTRPSKISVPRHHRVKLEEVLSSDEQRPPRLKMPHSLADRQVAYAMYRTVWSEWFSLQQIKLREHLRFLYRFHRATDGHIWIQDVDDGLAFVSWVLSLDPRIRAVIEVTPSARSPISSKQQAREWKQRLPSHQHKVEWRVKPAGSRYADRLGTGNVKLYVFNKNRSMRSSYPVRYVLVVSCIVMAAVAKREVVNDSQALPEAPPPSGSADGHHPIFTSFAAL